MVTAVRQSQSRLLHLSVMGRCLTADVGIFEFVIFIDRFDRSAFCAALGEPLCHSATRVLTMMLPL